MTRKPRYLALSLLFSLCACRANLPSPPPQAPTTPISERGTKPNFLLISIDDLNDWVEPLGGHPQVKTPSMNALAARGTTFVNAHVQAPVCNPSRTSLLTGLRPTTSGVYALNGWFRSSPALENHPTLFQHLRQQGYMTLTTGKIFHDGYPPAPRREDGSEVDAWGFLGSFLPRPEKRLVPGAITHPMIDWGIFPERDEQQDDWQVAEWAIERLKSPPQQPFVMAVGFRHPHVPLFATRAWFDLYPEDRVQLPPLLEDDRQDVPHFAWYLHWKLPEPRLRWLQENAQLRHKVRSYLASVSFVDHLVGRVLAALEASGVAERTFVILYSDHGYHLGEKGITGKNTLWERSTHVPLIVTGPGVTKNARVKSPAELLDLFPTLSELAGAPAPPTIEGVSLVPQLEDPGARRTRPAITSHGPGNHAVRDERHRYIRYADGSEELYDLQSDPNEWHNLAHEPQAQPLKARLAAHLPKVVAPPLAGSKSRLVLFEGGVPSWEGEAIPANAPVPGP